MQINDEVEYPICPYCGEITDLRGEFLPCCGEETKGVTPNKWVTLKVIEVRDKIITVGEK